MREKLIELLERWPCFETAENHADHLIANGVTVQKWIPVTERLPEEHNSIFAKLYGTKRWEPMMFQNVSDNVLAVVKFEDGTRKVKTVNTTDGEWRLIKYHGAKEVTHWMPLPEPPKEVTP